MDTRYQLTVRADRKVFRNGDFVMGFTSSFRMGQLLAYRLRPPELCSADLLAYMATDFIDAVRIILKDGGYARTKDGAEEGGTFLVGYTGRLFRIASDFQIQESSNGFDACGAGEQIALGSLWSTRSWGDPMRRLQEALAAAEALNSAVRGPFVFESTHLIPPAAASEG